MLLDARLRRRELEVLPLHRRGPLPPALPDPAVVVLVVVVPVVVVPPRPVAPPVQGHEAHRGRRDATNRHHRQAWCRSLVREIEPTRDRFTTLNVSATSSHKFEYLCINMFLQVRRACYSMCYHYVSTIRMLDQLI